MKKIGIMTIIDYKNYGNRLQSFALQHTLKKLGFEPESIRNKPVTHHSFLSKVLLKIKNESLKIWSIVKGKLKNANQEKFRETQNNRLRIFKEFTSQHINESDFVLSKYFVAQKQLEQYAFFISGSDQIWNPNFRHGSKFDFLFFAPQEKRLSYAASIGVDTIPEEYKEVYTEMLTEMNYISMREESGAQIVKELTGREAPVHVDPTMLLTKEEWLTVSERANNRPDTPYILTYFLGGPSDETRRKLNKIAKEKNMTVINLGDITEKDTYETGPSEFIDYIFHASALFTDSFHGVVFSIILETPFVVYERLSAGGSMYSRIETLLTNFNLKNREAKGFNEDVFSMEFAHTKTILKTEYGRSINYLKTGLRIEE